jgi:hypothetical protein
MNILDSKGVELISLQEKIDTASSGGRLIFHMLGALFNEKPHSVAIVRSINSGALSDWEAPLSRNGYDTKSLANPLNPKSSDVRQFFRGELDPARTWEMRANCRLSVCLLNEHTGCQQVSVC